jgi:hypothetical protein
MVLHSQSTKEGEEVTKVEKQKTPVKKVKKAKGKKKK